MRTDSIVALLAFGIFAAMPRTMPYSLWVRVPRAVKRRWAFPALCTLKAAAAVLCVHLLGDVKVVDVIRLRLGYLFYAWLQIVSMYYYHFVIKRRYLASRQQALAALERPPPDHPFWQPVDPSELVESALPLPPSHEVATVNDVRERTCELCMTARCNSRCQPCGHANTCRDCLEKWLQTPISAGVCPYCRAEVNAYEFMESSGNFPSYAQ